MTPEELAEVQALMAEVRALAVEVRAHRVQLARLARPVVSRTKGAGPRSQARTGPGPAWRRPEYRLYSVAEAAEALAVSERSAWRLVASGDLETVKLGARRLVPADFLDEYVAKNRGQVTPPGQQGASSPGPGDKAKFPI